MFKKSLILVALVVGMVFVSSFATQMVLTQDLPSSYDTGLTIDEAFKTAQTPLLIEFYADSCSTCRRLTPARFDQDTVERVRSDLEEQRREVQETARNPVHDAAAMVTPSAVRRMRSRSNSSRGSSSTRAPCPMPVLT